MRDGDHGDEERPQEDADPYSRPFGRKAHPFVLYVSEEPDGTRRLTGNGSTDWISADIMDAVSPGGTWNGLRYEDLLPGRYDIVENRFFREDGSMVPASEE